jgi:hypothetical protein
MKIITFKTHGCVLHPCVLNLLVSPTFRIQFEEFRPFFIIQLMNTLMLPSIGHCINYIGRATMKTLTFKTRT